MPGEIFLVMAKEGSTISGFADAFAQAISYALQYGVPLQALVDKFSHVRFEPSGMTRNPDVRFAKSIVDYIFRWMASKFLSPEAQYHAGVNNRDEAMDHPTAQSPRGGGPGDNGDAAAVPAPKAVATPTAKVSPTGAIVPSSSSFAAIQNQEDAPPCSTCGSIMVRSGACYKCTNCGTTSGCA
jgi:ribonucleoside-diphosphate reductase alpha chain